MSTLSTTNIKHPSSASNNVVLDSSGQVGIGTSTASNVTGTLLTINRASAAYTQYNQGTSGGCLVGTEGANVVFYTYTGNIGSESTSLRARLDGSGNLQFNSGYGSVATAYGVRAWVNFQGTGTVDIRASGNVSSITDNGSGDYTVNFATALSDASYCAFGSVIGSSNTDATDAFVSAGFNAATATHTTSAFRFTTAHRTQGAQDYNQVQVAVIR